MIKCFRINLTIIPECNQTISENPFLVAQIRKKRANDIKKRSDDCGFPAATETSQDENCVFLQLAILRRFVNGDIMKTRPRSRSSKRKSQYSKVHFPHLCQSSPSPQRNERTRHPCNVDGHWGLKKCDGQKPKFPFINTGCLDQKNEQFIHWNNNGSLLSKLD